MFKFIWPNKNVLGFEVNQLRNISATGDTARVTRLTVQEEPRMQHSGRNTNPLKRDSRYMDLSFEYHVAALSLGNQ